MKFPSLAIPYCVLIICCSYNIGNAQCKTGEIKIPVIFEFKSAEYRLQEIYNSLDPKIQLAISEPIRPSSERILDGKLELDFCVYPISFSAVNSSFSGFFGPRKITISRRQMKSQNEMATIWMLDQDDPDWIIVQNAKWIPKANGSPTLDIEVLNPTNNNQSGVTLFLDFSKFPKLKACLRPTPSTGRVYVSLSFNKGKIIAKSTDPQFNDLVDRYADFYIDPCVGEGYLKMELGPTGQLAAKDSLRIRYTFDMKVSADKKLGGLRNWRFRLEHIFLFGSQKIRIIGERTFPSEILIKR